MRETQVQSLGQEDPLEKEIATDTSILAWRIPWTEEPGGLQFMGSQRVNTTKWLTHNQATKQYINVYVCVVCVYTRSHVYLKIDWELEYAINTVSTVNDRNHVWSWLVRLG